MDALIQNPEFTWQGTGNEAEVVVIGDLAFDCNGQRFVARYRFHVEDGTLRISVGDRGIHLPTAQMVSRLMASIQNEEAEVIHAQVH